MTPRRTPLLLLVVALCLGMGAATSARPTPGRGGRRRLLGQLALGAPAAAAPPLRRALLAAAAEPDLAAVLAISDEEAVAQADAVLHAALTQGTASGDIPPALLPQLEAALRRFNAAVVPPLLRQLRAHRAEVEAFVADIQRRLPAGAPDSWGSSAFQRLLADPGFQSDLFKLLRVLLPDDVLATFLSAERALLSDVYDMLDAAGEAPPGTTKAEFMAQVDAGLAEVGPALKDEAAFKQALARGLAMAAAGPGDLA